MKKLGLAFLFCCSITSANANEIASNLVTGFCYSLQAAAVCPNLQVRLDTEGKLEDEIGVSEIRGDNSAFKSECMLGVANAIAIENSNLCEVAWQKYGCSGNEVPKLLQQNPFSVDDPVLCAYN